MIASETPAPAPAPAVSIAADDPKSKNVKLRQAGEELMTMMAVGMEGAKAKKMLTGAVLTIQSAFRLRLPATGTRKASKRNRSPLPPDPAQLLLLLKTRWRFRGPPPCPLQACFYHAQLQRR